MYVCMLKTHVYVRPLKYIVHSGLLLLLLLLNVSSVHAYSSNPNRIMIAAAAAAAATREKTLIISRRSCRPFWSSSSSSSSSAFTSFASRCRLSSLAMSTDNKSSHERPFAKKTKVVLNKEQQQQHQLQQQKKKKQKIAVIGGGLAGLSTVYHLLDKTVNNNNNNNNNNPSISSSSRRQDDEDDDDDDDEMTKTTIIQTITVWDRSVAVGLGGASAVAGGLVHPLSPSGKLVHWGMQGLEATNRLVHVACRAVAEKQQQQQQQQQQTVPCSLSVVLRHEILRLALTPQHVDQLLSTAQQQQQQQQQHVFSFNNNNNDNDNNNNDNVFSCRWLDAPEIAQRYNLSHAILIDDTTTTIASAKTGMHHHDVESSSADDDDKKKKIIRGGLLLSGGGCQVLHVPSYLQALWLACLELGQQGGIHVEWKQVETNGEHDNDHSSSTSDDYNNNNILASSSSSSSCWSRRLADYDTIVLAAGNGMFDDLIPLPLDKSNENDDDDDDNDDSAYLPVHLVRGQSIEMDLPPLSMTTAPTPSGYPFASDSSDRQPPALLCGKYVSPLPPSNGNARILIGATHEFQTDAMSPDQVISFLQDATAPMIPSSLWQQHGGDDDDDDDGHGHGSDGGRLKITSGFRVQSQRGKHGRMPIIGRYPLYKVMEQNTDNDASRTSSGSSQNKHASWCCRQDQNVWIFTGLSSRGLLYHALYGDFLTDAILANDEQVLWTKSPDLKWWWQKKKKK